MNKGSKTTLLVAVLCILVGIAIIAVAIAVTPGGFKKIWDDTVNTDNLNAIESIGGSGIELPGVARKWDNEYSSDGRYTASADVKGIDINWLSGKVVVKPYSGNDISFSETADKEITRDKALGWGIENGVLYIQYLKTNKMSVGSQDPVKTLEVLVPQKLAESLKSFDADATSADILVSDIKADEFETDTSSGDIYLTNIKAKALNIDTASGDAYINGVTIDGNIDIDTASGDTEISGTAAVVRLSTASGSVSAPDISAEELVIGTSSGDISIAGTIGKLEIDTASGVVSAGFRTFPDEIDIDTSSGSVTLEVPSSGGGFTLDYDSGSGDLDCGVPVMMKGSEYVYGDGSCSISVDTGSGDLTLKFAV